MKKQLNISIPLLFFWSIFANANSMTLVDERRQRLIPVSVTLPSNTQCSVKKPCSVAILSSGYGVSHTEYQFIADTFLQSHTAVVTVQHQLKTDPPLSIIQPYLLTRAENWQRGSDNLSFVLRQLSPLYPILNFNKLTLVGHSNGGDISAWYLRMFPEKIGTLITLDHRRVPLPRVVDVRVLSIRGSDFPADDNVLYTPKELKEFQACVVTIPNSRHNDMTDYGPAWLKTAIKNKIGLFINQAQCG